MKKYKMTGKQLDVILREMYDKAPEGYQVANIHFLGVKYAEIIQGNYINISERVRCQARQIDSY